MTLLNYSSKEDQELINKHMLFPKPMDFAGSCDNEGVDLLSH
jgi:hypothetical protein